MTNSYYQKMHQVLLLITAIVLGASYYLQYMVHLNPCPLCLMQRLCIFLLLMVLLFVSRLTKRVCWIYLLSVFLSAAGLFFAARQLWLQSLPPGSVSSCMPALDILVQYFPWQAVLKTLVWGSADCAEHVWAFAGLSLAAWSALYFTFMLLSFLGLALCKFWPSSRL